MGIQERMREIAEAQAKAKQEAKAREIDLKNQYNLHLSEALRTRTRLLEDLRTTGVVEMIEEMIDPDKIPENYTTVQQGSPGRPFFLTPSSPLDKRQISETIAGGTQQRNAQMWKLGHMTLPQQKEDGTPDPTLNFDITSVMNPLYHVRIAYSPDHVLRIQGAEVTFEGTAARHIADKGAIETALARAFLNPEKIEALPGHDSWTTNVIGPGEGFQRGESFTG